MKLGKKTNQTKEYTKAVHNIHKHKMAVIGCFIFGFDTDTKAVFKNTLKMIKKLKIDIADFCALTPFPGTPTYTKLQKEKRIITTDWGKYNLKNVVFKPKNMTLTELQDGIKRMYIEFYSPVYTIQRITRSLKLGIYPFISVKIRNIIATMNSRKLF